MSEIVRVPFEQSGVHDSVELVASCAYSEFLCDESGNPEKLKGVPVVYPCKIMASYEDGTVSISARYVGAMLSVRIEEMLAVLRDAGIAALESRANEEAHEEDTNVQEDAATQG